MGKKKYPKEGTRYYCMIVLASDPDALSIHILKFTWNNTQNEKDIFNSGNFYLTKREAEAARRQLTKLVKDFFKKGKK